MIEGIKFAANKWYVVFEYEGWIRCIALSFIYVVRCSAHIFVSCLYRKGLEPTHGIHSRLGSSISSFKQAIVSKIKTFIRR